MFPLASVSRLALRPTQFPIQRVLGVLSPEAKVLPQRDLDHSPVVENEWKVYSLLLVVFMALAGHLYFL
jgi:hypothetical protein